MKTVGCSLLLLFAPLFLSAQEVPKLYTDLEKNYNEGQYDACVKLEKEVLALSNQRSDTLVANSFFYLGTAQLELGKTEKAIVFFEKEKKLRAQLGLTATEEYSNSLNNLVYLYYELGKYEESGKLLTELLSNDKKTYGATGDVYIQTVINAAETLLNLDRLEDAENLLETTLKQQAKSSGNYGLLLSKAGDIYTFSGQYSKANTALIEALPILEKTYGTNSNEHILALFNYGTLYMWQGKYAEAEEVFDTVLDLIDPNQKTYVAALNNQGLVYRRLGQLEKAEGTFSEIRGLDSATVGTSHPDYAITLSNIALVQTDEGKYKYAEENLLKALEVRKKNNESKTLAYARLQLNLARVYQSSGQAGKAIPLLEQASGIFKSSLGQNSPEYATALFNLGMANWKSGNGSVGIKQLKSSASIRASILGKKHPLYAESTQKIAEYQWLLKQHKEAKQTFGEVFDNYYYQVDVTFPVLTEEEKAKFYYNNIRPSFDKFNAFAVQSRAEVPAILGDVYNHQINTKAVIMLATEKVKLGIKSMNDPELSKQFEDWQALKEQIAKMYSQNQQPSTLDSMMTKADRLEKELTRKSSAFAAQYIKKKYTWQDVQKGLKPGEAAVEVVRYNNYTPENGGLFLNEAKYAFLIVTTQTKEQPDLILLSNGNELETKFMNFYRNSIKFQQEDPYSFKNYFEPLNDYLKKNGVNKFFLSPEGVYNQININSIRNPFTQKYLLDEYEIQIITNTRELADKTADKRVGQTPVLMGFPKFNQESEGSTKTAETRGGTRGATRGGGITRGLRGGLLRYMRGEDGISVLPGTQKEINEISALFTDKPAVFMESNAAEQIIKDVDNPRILHIATHGYFLEDDVLADGNKTHYVANPLLKAGLILAGAENFLTTGIPVNDDGDDGILTAYEAMNLKLDNTDLVVLSACETGLGQVKNGEGVYGLQRAFKLAGARSMVMSLWNVDDDATQELMSIFYKEMLGGKEQHEAFRTAQQKLKEKYAKPFYWGAFIMVGI